MLVLLRFARRRVACRSCFRSPVNDTVSFPIGVYAAAMTLPRIVLVHGAAVTAQVWDPLLPHLADLDAVDVVVPERPRTGDLGAETEWLAGYARGAFVVGMSGGATLGLALAATDVPMAGALLHEPAVGRLMPGLLAPVRQAWQDGGVAGFGATLYGPGWTPEMAVDSDESLGRELAMFSCFEPGPPAADQGRVVISVGAESPTSRHRAAAALADRFGYPTTVIAGAGHFVAQHAPAAFAAALRALFEPARR